MKFSNVTELEKAGFRGFRTIKDLKKDPAEITEHPGIYLILFTAETEPEFLAKGTGGAFKGKNPNVSQDKLRDNWVSGALVIYIGQTTGQSLKKRLKQYFEFGSGKSVGHWGGRLIWQLQSSDDLLVCWKAIPDGDPRSEEKELISEFVMEFGQRPFANLQG